LHRDLNTDILRYIKLLKVMEWVREALRVSHAVTRSRLAGQYQFHVP
jgi:hypothetical protein